MRQFLQNLLQRKYAITYTLNAMENMVPREIRWLNKLPILRFLATITQFFWFITKIIFFTIVFSWFKPQYNNVGAKIALMVITFGVIFFAWWIIKREFDGKNALA